MNDPELDDDGYPTEETLQKIEKWEYSKEYKFSDLLEYVSKVWHWSDYMTSRKTVNTFGDPIIEYKCVTGGWSGNEELIIALSKNYLFWGMCWRESHRGGKHIFEVRR